MVDFDLQKNMFTPLKGRAAAGSSRVVLRVDLLLSLAGAGFHGANVSSTIRATSDQPRFRANFAISSVDG